MNDKDLLENDKGSFDKKLSEYIENVEGVLDELSVVPDIPQRVVYEAMRYSLMGGGKRVRPVLAMAVTEMLGGDTNVAAKAASAIECIHTYSLIHDDLPCMDNDDMRRGRPTCHRAFPESTALLAGDGLLTAAFELLSGKYTGVDADTGLRLVRVLSAAAGCRGMIGGQILDLEGEGRDDMSLDELCLMHRLKTGAMIEVSAEFGCILCGLYDEDDERLTKIREFSNKLGLAFQIKDDILDVMGDEVALGKPIGSDEVCGKTTFVTLMGLGGAEDELNRLTREAIDALDIFGDSAWFLRKLAMVLLKRNK